ncbi:MAG TPA: aspartate--tRNA ligase [Clostridiales bacterium UBA8153]|nr:aspartate--tRNA ligase [Clostridiales bacterium UBA8153]
MTVKRSASCGQVTLDLVGQSVTVMGWVHRRRDHGGLVFVDVRDAQGWVQVVFNRQIAAAAYELAERLRVEYVVAISGVVNRRETGRENPRIATGLVEIAGQRLEILNEARTPPLHIADQGEADEAVRLRYRYLDLRRPEMYANLLLRHRTFKTIRDFFDAQGFLEVETPCLTRSTPEGARDYLVPSRLQPGYFYALPQSPQLFKQLLMVSGVDRYVQLARCFRDEDLRADRQPEFTQLDIEMAFVDEEDIFGLLEQLFVHLYRQVLNVEITRPFPRLTYQEAMTRYGTDKPDLRYGLPIADLSGILGEAGFKVFRTAVASGGVVRALQVPGAAGLSRRELDELNQQTLELGAAGLTWLTYTEQGVRSPAAKSLGEDTLAKVIEALGLNAGDLALFAAGPAALVARVLGQLRVRLAGQLGLVQPGSWKFVWITHFPLLEYSEEEGKFTAAHHPFTSPRPEDAGLLETDPGAVRARAYDLVLDGVELASGSIRIHRRELQERVFRALGIEKDEAERRFGFLLEAFEYGTPPHGGIAFGLDRVVMMMAGCESIREVIAFPKTSSAACPLTGAPTGVDPRQLQELQIQPVRRS